MISKIAASICLLLCLFSSLAFAQQSSRALEANRWDTENLVVLNSLGISLIPTETAHSPPSIVGFFDARNPAGLITSFLSTVSGRKSMLIDGMIDADGRLNVTITPLTLSEARDARPETRWAGWKEFWTEFIADSISSKRSYDISAETDGSFELYLGSKSRVTVSTSTAEGTGFYTFATMYLSDQQAEFDELPAAVQRRILKLELPMVGNVAFQPEISKTEAGRPSIVRGEIKTGVHRGQIGLLDIDGRIWIRNQSQQGASQFWSVLIGTGDQLLSVDNSGNKI